MALVPAASIGGNTVVLYADVVAGQVVGARLENNSGRTVEVTYVRPNDRIVDGTFGPGVHTMSLPRGRQFSYDTVGDLSVSLTLR